MSSPEKTGHDRQGPALAPEIFPEDEEKRLCDESNELKANANTVFVSGEYTGAIQGYEKALAVCPNYLEYDIAVLHSNIAACHIKLAEWKEAVESATKALDALDMLDPPTPANNLNDGEEKGQKSKESPGNTGAGGIITEVDDSTETYLEALQRTGRTIHDVHKLRTKALLRRAKARHQVGGWASLQSSLEDYQSLSRPPHHHQLSSLDRSAVQAALRTLPAEIEQVRTQEMADMMGKLKQLGNGILKPFGLSTDNFKFEQDEASGGYSMNFEQNPGAAAKKKG